MKKSLALILFTFHFPLSTFAQSSLRDSSVNGLLLGFSYGYQLPFADMEKRFGGNGQAGVEINYKLRNNFTFGVGGGFIFGRTVKEDNFLDSIASHEGFFVNYNGVYSDIALFERGYTLEGNIGKIIPAFGSNPNSGIYVRLGAGFMQHKIRITDTEGIIYQVNEEYAKGYDRLSNGLMLSQYVGFLNIDPRHLLNFHVGLLAQEAFTQNRRSWNFDERRQDNDKRLDVLIGLRATWMLPFFSKNEQRYYTH